MCLHVCCQTVTLCLYHKNWWKKKNYHLVVHLAVRVGDPALADAVVVVVDVAPLHPRLGDLQAALLGDEIKKIKITMIHGVHVFV